jgi:hypothetical protein
MGRATTTTNTFESADTIAPCFSRTPAAEREAKRQSVRDAAIARAVAEAERMFMTARCHLAVRSDWGPEFHAPCRGDVPGNSGCLCRCHDDPGVENAGTVGTRR